jgi:hypothetical protein
MMDYISTLKNFRKKFKGSQVFIFLEFLDTLREWIERLYELKRISVDQKLAVDLLLPRKILQKLSSLSSSEVDDDLYLDLKELLLEETTKLIYAVIEVADMRLYDFDLLQFNLYQIFGKEEMASMVEWARLNFQKALEAKKKKEAEEIAKKEKEWAEYLVYIRNLPEDQLRRRAISILFDFTPSAQTLEERQDALRTNRKTILGHRKTFHHFKETLMTATEDARAKSELNVYGRMGEVKRYMGVTAGKFKQKAAEFSSAEGPKRMIREAHKRINDQSIDLGVQMKDVGERWEAVFGSKVKESQESLKFRKEELTEYILSKGRVWEEDFMVEVASARDRISTLSGRLKYTVQDKGQGWIEGFQKDIGKARKRIGLERTHLSGEKKDRLNFMKSHGEKEFSKASDLITFHTREFVDDIDHARKRFAGKESVILEKRGVLGDARESFKEKRDVAAEAFISRGAEVEVEMYGTIYHEKTRFSRDRDAAQTRFFNKALEIQGKATRHVSGKKYKFISDRDSAQKKFYDAKVSFGDQIPEDFVPDVQSTGVAKGRIASAYYAVTEESKRRRNIMQKKMEHQRDLFQYDVRFAQHRIKQNSIEFRDRSLDKQEEFVSRGKQLVARHKARQKAHLIQNLLKTIRKTH